MMGGRAILAAVAISIYSHQVIAYSSGGGNCKTGPQGGGPHGQASATTATAGDFSITVKKGATVTTTYQANTMYTVTLSRTSSFKGFLMGAVKTANKANMFEAGNTVGTFSAPASGALFQRKCGQPLVEDIGVVTHTDSSAKTSMEFSWTAPNSDTGPITFYAWGVVTKTSWFGSSNSIASSELTFDSTPPVPAPVPVPVPAPVPVPVAPVPAPVPVAPVPVPVPVSAPVAPQAPPATESAAGAVGPVLVTLLACLLALVQILA